MLFCEPKAMSKKFKKIKNKIKKQKKNKEIKK
jgi:hypothetical protein